MSDPEETDPTADLVSQLVKGTGDAVLVVDAAGRVVRWNQGAEVMFGWSALEAVGQPMDRMIPPRLRERHWAGFRTAVETGETRYGPAELLAVPALTADGRTISIEFTVTPLRGPDGSVSHVGAIIRDVTARRTAEVELRRRLRELEPAPPAPADEA